MDLKKDSHIFTHSSLLPFNNCPSCGHLSLQGYFKWLVSDSHLSYGNIYKLTYHKGFHFWYCPSTFYPLSTHDLQFNVSFNGPQECPNEFNFQKPDLDALGGLNSAQGAFTNFWPESQLYIASGISSGQWYFDQLSVENYPDKVSISFSP